MAEEKPEIPKVEILKILGKNVSPVIFSSITALTAINPIWAVIFGTALGIFNIWGDFGQSRINELTTFISEHKEEFIEEIIESDSFKTLFLNILERHMKESSEEKRKLLRNYLLNMGKGINADFNEYTRMNNAMDDITLYEIDLLKLWDDNGPINIWYRNRSENNPKMVATIGVLQTYIRDMKPRDEWLMRIVSDENKSKNNQTLLLLGYKGLLYVLAEDNFGSGQEVKVKDITDFGKAFLSFIKE